MSKNMNVLSDANVLIDSFNKSKKGSIWKEPVQRYEINLLKNIHKTQNNIKSRNYNPLPVNEFILCERGKTRDIKAIQIDDRVVLRSLCDNILLPYLKKYLIYDNGASLKNKGIGFTRKRFVTHLRKYCSKYGNNGYILFIDFTKFFDNILHDKLIEIYSKYIKDEELISFIQVFIKCFEVDVSYLNDEEYRYCLKEIYNALDHINIDESLLTKDKFMGKSIGIGSQISQISGVLYPSEIDNYCKIVKSIKYYGRYMDDTYIIHNDKNYLKQLLVEIENICNKYGIFINHNKTQIVKLSKKFNFLKRYYIVTESGKVIELMNKDTITRERRKLKKFRSLLNNGEITYKEIEELYKSWKGNIRKCSNCYHIIKNMDEFYNKLFIMPFISGEDFYENLFKKRN